MYFNGKTYQPELDKVRLTGQVLDVWTIMKDGNWRTLAELSKLTRASEASVSARLRDFRKRRFGSHTVDVRKKGDPKNGLHEYQVTPSENVKVVEGKEEEGYVFTWDKDFADSK